MKPFIIVSDGFDSQLFSSLSSDPNLEVHPEKKIDRETLKKLLPKASGLVIRSATTVDKELIDIATKLRLVIRAGEGTDNIDKNYAKEKEIAVCNTPGANSNSAAEHTVSLMLSVLRHIPFAHKTMTEGRWDKSQFTGNELWNKTVGIVGMGKIGQIVAKRIQGFDPSILFYDPNCKNTEGQNYKKCESLEEIFEQSDIISLHLPLTEQTKNIIDKKLLGKMKEGAILINAARGGIVNESDLLEVLKNFKIRAGFDVFGSEPLAEDSPLRNLPNLVVTPHLGASTADAQFRVGEMVIHQLKEFFSNNNTLNQVNK